MRATPFDLVFAELAAEQFPLIAEALRQNDVDPMQRDRFVLLEPVGRLLRSIVPDAAGADALEAHVLLLHHAYLHWAGGSWVYQVSERALRSAITNKRIASDLRRSSLYLQLPELRVWGSPNADAPAEPLDGMFVSGTAVPGEIAVLGIFGLRPDRPGFSAVGLQGHADADDASGGEIEVAAAREDGTAAFGPMLTGGTAAGLYSVANPGELLLLTSRLLTLLDSAASP
ncbi:MAG: hypothetical protein AUI08_09215 [Gemmatimonadetes bacterium 13_2_20CM_2_65_7]|nr:MAG: hypothetical protein AUI08_09215 [Gemmatimonadetes bacterium 13_2_20CM_2_65_7]